MISRRQFLGYGAAIGGALTFLGEKEVPKHAVRLAAIGLDETALDHLDAAIGTGHVEIVAIAETPAIRREVLAECFRSPRIIPSIANDGLAAIDTTDADAIFIGSTHAECAHWLDAALARKCHVLLQNPPAMPLTDWDCRVKQFHDAGLELEYVSTWRHDDAFKRFTAMLEESNAGRWDKISIACSASAREMARSFESPSQGLASAFLPMFDALSHLPADMTPEIVFATGDRLRQRRNRNVPRNTFAGAIKTRGGIEVSLSCSIVPDSSSALEIVVTGAQRDDSHALGLDRRQFDVAPFWASWVAAKRGEARPATTHRSHALAATWARELARSWATGQTLHLDCSLRVHESMT